MGKWTKGLVGAGVLAGAAYAVWRVLEERSRASRLDWTAQPFPSPPKPVVREPATHAAAEQTAADPAPHGAPDGAPDAGADGAWVGADGDHCPASHPVKAKLASGIYHSPGGQMYDRTIPDRCYRDAAAAEADGLRASKR